MSTRLPNIVLGVAFAVFATVGYMYAYKVGIWKPDSATQQAIYEIRDRADRISAAEIATQAKVILDKSEAERKLDIEALTKAVQAGPPKCGASGPTGNS